MSSEGWEFIQATHIRNSAEDVFIMVKPVVEPKVNIQGLKIKIDPEQIKDTIEAAAKVETKPKAKRSPRSTKTSK